MVAGEPLFPLDSVSLPLSPCITAIPAAERAHRRASCSGRQQQLQQLPVRLFLDLTRAM